MSNRTDGSDGGHAFPFITPLRDIQHVETGMSLRDYFAGQALAGLAGPHGDGFSLPEEDFAEWAYRYADAMLAARDA